MALLNRGVGQAVSPANGEPQFAVANSLFMLEYRRRLPHFHPGDAYLFLTWRLWGSLPARPPSSRPYLTAGHASVAADRALDRAGAGPVWLKDPRIAGLVVETMLTGEQERRFYELRAGVVMPNHVHLAILPKVEVPVIMRWLKGSTARRANQLLGRSGQPFWQDESYDHWVRNRKELDRTIGYIEENPVSAGLVDSVELWPFSSAGWQAKPPAPSQAHLPA
jgi:REP element-mobilizing transposase RayT